jgi:hypothetical protein
MAKKNGKMPAKNGRPAAKKSKRPERMILSTEEVIKRMLSFPERREAFIAAIRKGKNRGVSS